MKRDDPYQFKPGLSIANEPPDNLFLTVDVRLYPDMDFLYKTLSLNLNINKNNLIIGNGVENTIKNILLAIKPNKISWFTPTWGFIDVYCKLLNIKKDKKIFKYKNNSFIEKNIKNIDLYYTTLNINNFFHHNINYENIKKSKICILDASYVNLIDNKYKKLINDVVNNNFFCKNTILIGSFDKIFGAGLRCGYAIFPKNLCNKILLLRENFINCVASKFISNNRFIEPKKYFYYMLKKINFNNKKIEYSFICKNFISLGFKSKQKIFINHKYIKISNLYLYRFGIPNNINEYNTLVNQIDIIK